MIVGKCEKLLKRAQNNPRGLRLAEAVKLAECYGFVFSRQRGDHLIYKRPGYERVINLQNDNGMAKSYQVDQLLTAIEEVGSYDAVADEEEADGQV